MLWVSSLPNEFSKYKQIIEPLWTSFSLSVEWRHSLQGLPLSEHSVIPFEHKYRTLEHYPKKKKYIRLFITMRFITEK